MKKTVVFLLLSIFLFNTVGYYFAFKLSQIEVKRELESQLKSGLLNQKITTLAFNKNQLGNIVWQEKNKEFYFNNKLYDVISISEINTEIVIQCISDIEEENLFEDLEKHIASFIASNEDKNKSNSKKLVDHVVKIYFFHSFDFNFHSNISSNHYSDLEEIYRSEVSETKAPPPKFA